MEAGACLAYPRPMITDAPSPIDPELLPQLLEHMAEGVFVSSPDRFLYVNRAGLEILGVESLSRLREVHPAEVYAEPDQRRELVDRLQRQGWVRRVEVDLVRPDGTRRHVVGSATLFRSADAEAPRFLGVFSDVTELRESERRLEAMLEASPVPIVLLGVDGEVEIWNPATEELLGYSREEIDGQIDVVIPPELREESRASRERLRRGESIRGLVTRRLRKDGSEVVVRLSAAPIRDAGGTVTGYMTISEDITESVARHQALQRNEERLREITENIREVLFMVSRDFGEMTYVSPGYEEIWGRPVEDLYEDPLSWLEAVHPDDRQRTAEEVREHHRRGTPYALEYRILRPAGDLRWIRVRGFPVREDGEIVRFTGIAEDVTERKRLEDRLQQARRMETVGRLAGGIAHEFNNLLTSVKGHAELMLEELSDEGPLRDDAAEIVDAAGRAAKLTRQLQTFARRRRAEPIPVDLNETIVGMRERLRAGLGDRPELRLQLERSIGPVRIDPLQLEELLAELVENAGMAMPEGGTLTLETRRVGPDEAAALLDEAGTTGGRREKGGRGGSADSVEPEAYALLAVRDSGVGMDEEVRDQAFEPFFTTRDIGEGTGLGLAHVHGIVQEARGRIWVESEPGEGTTFHVLLPLVDADRGSLSGDP